MMLNSPSSPKTFSELIQNETGNTAPLELQLNCDNDPSPEMFRNAMQSDILGNSVTSAEASPLMSPHLASPVASQQPLADSDTQMSMVRQAAGLQLSDNKPSTINSNQLRIFSGDTDGDHVQESLCKVLKVDDGSDASTAFGKLEQDTDTAYDMGLAGSNFEFMKFGFSTHSDQIELPPSPTSVSNRNELIYTVGGPVCFDELTQQSLASSGSVITITPTEKPKEPSLNRAFSAKCGDIELKVLNQPEEQHRARYQTEGSRGAVKDKCGQSHPRVQLVGINQPVTLQVYIGSDNSKFKPHGFYQACKVSGKNATACTEKEMDGTTVIEIQLEPANDMIGLIDCVGILKLRNSDVQQRIGQNPRSKKKSTKARMIFRVNIPQPQGSYLTLQVASSQILCTQPTGIPEICRMSLDICSSEGGQDLFIIGKNFLKLTKVHFQEKGDGEEPKWEAEAIIDSDYFHASHMIVKIPPYKGTTVGESVSVMVVVSCGGRTSEGTPFTYTSAHTSNGTEHPSPPGVGMLLTDSLFGTSGTEPDIFNDPGGSNNLTFKVEPNVMSPELPPVSEEVRVPMDTGDCPPSKISKISECVSPEAEKLALEFIVQSSQKNDNNISTSSSSSIYTQGPATVSNEVGVVIQPEEKEEHMDTEATPKDTQTLQRKTSLKSGLETAESSVNLNAANEELQKLMSTISPDHHSENPSGTNTPISPPRPSDRFSESLQNSPFSPEPQLPNEVFINSGQISQPQFTSPTQAPPPPEITQEIFAGEDPRTPTFTIPQHIQVEHVPNCQPVENINPNPEEQNRPNPGEFILGPTTTCTNEQPNLLANAILNVENVIDPTNVEQSVPNLHAFQAVARKQDPPNSFNEENQVPTSLDSLMSTLSADLINVAQQAPFNGINSALDQEMPPNVSVRDLPQSETTQIPLPLSMHNSLTDNKSYVSMEELLAAEINVSANSVPAVSSSTPLTNVSGVNYFMNTSSENETQMIPSSSPSVSMGFVSAVSANPAQQTAPLNSDVSFMPTESVVNHIPMQSQLQNPPIAEEPKSSIAVQPVDAVHSEPAKEGGSPGTDQNLMKDLLKGLNELCGLMKQNQKSETQTSDKMDQDVESTKEKALMSAIPDQSAKLIEVLQSQMKGSGDSQQMNIGGLLQNMLSQQHQQQQLNQQQRQQHMVQQHQTTNSVPMIFTSSVNTRSSVQVENHSQVKVVNAQPISQNGTIQSGVQVVTSSAQALPQALTNRGVAQVIKQPNGQPMRLLIDQSKTSPSQGVQMANIANITALVQGSSEQKTGTASSTPLTFVPLNNSQGQTIKFVNVSGSSPIMIANPSQLNSRPITIVRGSANNASASFGEVQTGAEGVNIKNGLLAQLLTEPTSALQTVTVPQSQQHHLENMDTSGTQN